jgi:hypothetical protein
MSRASPKTDGDKTDGDKADGDKADGNKSAKQAAHGSSPVLLRGRIHGSARAALPN